ncbi:kinase [Paraneptunicella aestuarii]|nr:kinase [Paraneptunicella aestuarii]
MVLKQSPALSGKPLFIGVNGCQGSGKSTLSDFLHRYFSQEKGLSSVVMSLDDFYFDRNTRATLANSIHPMLQTRGVPGTHDTEKMHDVLTTLKQSKTTTIAVPRFNKAQDNPYPESQWSQLSSPVDIVIMEGWCWGVEAQSDEQLQQPVNELESQQDMDGTWRKYVNQCLKNDYEPLYALMDYWVMLKAPAFSQVFKWRCEQEHKLAASLAETSNTKVMSDAQIWDFIQYYQRLTEHGLNTLPPTCDKVFELGNDRSIHSVT